VTEKKLDKKAFVKERVMENLSIFSTEDEEDFVNSFDLYEKLDVKSPYRNWIRRRLKCFEEDLDYFQTLEMTLSGQNRNTFYVTTDVAKHLCMMQNNEKGRFFRQKFIDLEKEIQRKKIEDVSNVNSISDDIEIPAKNLHSMFNVAKLIPGMPEQQAFLRANTWTKSVYGIDFHASLGSPNLISENQEQSMNARDLGKLRFWRGQEEDNYLSAIMVNKILTNLKILKPPTPGVKNEERGPFDEYKHLGEWRDVPIEKKKMSKKQWFWHLSKIQPILEEAYAKHKQRIDAERDRRYRERKPKKKSS
jgi:phage anti-repressor protein